MKIIKVLPLLMVAGLSLVGCKGTGNIDNVKKTGFLNVGITMYEPMDYFADNGEIVEYGSPNEVFNSSKEKTKSFLNSFISLAG